MKKVLPELSAKRAAAGREGGYATFFRYGREEMQRRGKLGGRPRLKTLEELESQFCAPELQQKERRHRLPGDNLLKSAGGALRLKIKAGEPAGRGSCGSPERRE